MLYILSLTTPSTRPSVRHNPHCLACSRRSKAEPRPHSADGSELNRKWGKWREILLPRSPGASYKLRSKNPSDGFHKLINESELDQINTFIFFKQICRLDYQWYFAATKLYIAWIRTWQFSPWERKCLPCHWVFFVRTEERGQERYH